MDKIEWQEIKDRWESIEEKGYADFSISKDILILIVAIENCEEKLKATIELCNIREEQLKEELNIEQ